GRRFPGRLETPDLSARFEIPYHGNLQARHSEDHIARLRPPCFDEILRRQELRSRHVLGGTAERCAPGESDRDEEVPGRRVELKTRARQRQSLPREVPTSDQEPLSIRREEGPQPSCCVGERVRPAWLSRVGIPDPNIVVLDRRESFTVWRDEERAA